MSSGPAERLGAASGAADYLRRFGMRLDGQDWSLLIVAALIGVAMSGVAMAFILPLRWVEGLPGDLRETRPTLLLWLIPIAPIVGALLCGFVRRLLPSNTIGHGVPAVMYAIHRRQSRLPLRLAASKWLSSTFTIASGGSAGPEGPIVTIGASIGSWLGRRLGAAPTTTGTLLGCAAAAGIASVFNAPIAGIFFVLEVLLRDFSLRTFTPIVIAAVISSATTQAVLGSAALFGVDSDFYGFDAGASTLLQIPNHLLLGAVAGAVAAGFIRGMGFVERLFARLPVPELARPVCGAALLGALGLAYMLSAPNTSPLPVFYGNGYLAIERFLDPSWYLAEGGTMRPLGATVLLLLALVGLKALATWLTLGSGGSGGLFAPALFLGAALGGAGGALVAASGWFPGANPAHYALVGMAAMIAATSHAPLTAILLVYEITRSYEIILPLMLASVIATIVGRLLCRESVYTVKLAALGVRLGGTSDLPLLRRLVTADVPLMTPVLVRADESAQRLLDLSEETGSGDFVVIDHAGRYEGMVTGVDLRRALLYREAIPLMQVDELTRRDLPTVLPDETLDLVLEKFNHADVHCLAVLSESGDRTVHGVIARGRVLKRYAASLDAG